MLKNYLVTCELDKDNSQIENFVVTAISKSNAVMITMLYLIEKMYYGSSVIDCKLLKDNYGESEIKDDLWEI